MHGPSEQSTKDGARTLLIVWATVATIIGIVSTCLALYTVLRLRTLSSAKSVPAADSTEARISLNTTSLSNRVSLCFEAEECGSGLELVSGKPDTDRDGLTAVTTVNGVRCRYVDFEGQKTLRKLQPGIRGFLYFKIDPAFKKSHPDISRVRIDVEHWNQSPGELSIEYDSIAPVKDLDSKYAHTSVVNLLAANQWQMQTFHIQNAAFNNAQNGKADFRLWTRRADLYIRRVTVTIEP